MEIFELRYFFEVAKLENIQRASKVLSVSPGSLSKAIARIEDELGAKLFAREGRHIRLTDHGRLLKLRASQILQLEEAARVEIAGLDGRIRVVVAGPEVLLAKMGVTLTSDLHSRYAKATFEYHACDEARALDEVASGEAHLALVTGDVPAGLTAKNIAEATFVTVAGPGHPLYARAKARKPVAIEDILEFEFVSPSRPILGKVGLKQSLDGWRDDVFTRNVAFLTTSVKLLETLLVSGRALAYLPDYYAEQLEVVVITVTGCPYACAQKIKLVARRPKTIGWLNHLFYGVDR